jgi:hypothetical protein
MGERPHFETEGSPRHPQRPLHGRVRPQRLVRTPRTTGRGQTIEPVVFGGGPSMTDAEEHEESTTVRGVRIAVMGPEMAAGSASSSRYRGGTKTAVLVGLRSRRGPGTSRRASGPRGGRAERSAP